ncbi:MAG: zinc-finger domain-containing protein [Arenicellales bacterium]|nr:zinc-finger domain-containing protein [Arenicellales bacterium]
MPLFCPREDTTLWNQHPRVYLPIEKGGDALCPYCGTRFILKDNP